MAEPKKFTDLPITEELSLSAIFAVVMEQGGELISLQCSATQIAEFITDGIELQGLTTESKRLIGAINELNEGGGGGSSVTMEDNPNSGVDLTVEGTTKTLAKQRDLDTLYKITQGQSWDFVDQQESGTNLAPKGTERQSLISVDGHSIQGENPTPDNPQPITSVEQLNFKVTGRNLFDFGLFSIGGMDNGTKAEYVSYRMTNATNPISALYAIPVVGGQTYTLSIDISKSKYLGVRCGVHTLNENGEFMKDSGWLQFATKKTRSITFLENARYALFVLSFSTTSTQVSTGSTESMERLDIDYIKNNVFIMFEAGATATAYEPYREPTTHTITPPFALNKIGDFADFADVGIGNWNYFIKTITEADYIHSIEREPSYFLLDTPTETPIEATDLEFLKSLQNLDSDNVITITDQNGNDISYLMKYLIKLSEAI